MLNHYYDSKWATEMLIGTAIQGQCCPPWKREMPLLASVCFPGNNFSYFPREARPVYMLRE